MPTNFIYDGTGFSNQPKTDLVPIGGSDPLKHVQAVDWNTVVQAALDIQTFLRGGMKLYKTSDTTKHCDVVTLNGDPNGVLTAEKGSLCVDITNVKLYQNTTGGTVWQVTNTDTLNYGWFGTGIDGSPTFDGSTTILGMVPSSNIYTMVRDLFLDSPVGVAGVTIKTNGFAVYVKTDLIGPATGMFTIQDDGPAGSGSAAGTGRQNGAPDGGPGRLKGGKSGGAGGVNNAFGGAGVASPNSPKTYPGGNGGAGGGPNAGGASTTVIGSAILGSIGELTVALRGYGSDISGGGWFTAGSGGGGGGSNGLGTGSGGGGGAGGGYTALLTKHVTNPANVTFSANGGNGAAASGQTGGNSSGGGGGGGGGLAVLVLGYGTAPITAANGGTGGAGAGGSGTSGANGTGGQVLPFKMSS